MAIRKKKVVKKKATKKRTPAQIRATKRLVALNKKKRAAKKAPVKKKRVTRKKSAVRKSNPITKTFVAFTVQDGTKFYYVGYNQRRGIPVFDTDKGKAQIYMNPAVAKNDIGFIVEKVFPKSTAKRILPIRSEAAGK